ncbi:hypothetical protein D6774_03225 [Candidatus Woesearchaeota archaeon]|nr:MAG: hypothetical protein D6774_03225 [Candidatus Woesearchaeota archaeon]
MTKKQVKQTTAKEQQTQQIDLDKLSEEMIKRLPQSEQERIAKNKKDLDKFVKECTKKFSDYILGIGLLPFPRGTIGPDGKEIPPMDASGKPIPKESMKLIVLVDDQDSQKMSKLELKEKLMTINEQIAQDINKNLHAESILLSELWQSLYDGKLDILQMFALAAPLYDKGMLAALKIGEIHKSMAIKKFEKYIVSYVLFGSLTRGEATHTSDIDVAIIVDDTDVKKMTLMELKDKLRAIIHGMGVEAGELTGIRNKLNIQVYILTEFWDSVKEANPVIFTILRDGVPLYDRGMFMPWKQLLRMGKIKPSQEAIDLFMSSGEQMISRIKHKLRGLVEADLYWSTLTPTQAALMLYGIAPPTPKETIKLMEDIFVKEGLLEKKYVNIMQEIRDYYKGLEHGEIKEITGKEVDDLLTKAEDYLARIKKLFEQIEEKKAAESVLHTYEAAITAVRDTLNLEGVERIPEDKVETLFDEVLVSTGKIPQKYKRILSELIKAKKEFEQGKLNKHDIAKYNKDGREFIRHLVEYIQRKRGEELERTKIRVKYAGNKYGEVILLEDHAYVIRDIDAPEKEVSKAKITEEGGISGLVKASLEELEKDLTKPLPKRVFIKQAVFEDLKEIFGEDVEVLMKY